jgi:LPS-assembly protein
MKNKFILIIKIFFIFYFIFTKSLANEFIFETKEIQILEDGNIIKAIDGVAISTENNFSITGKEFKFDKKNSSLIALIGLAEFPDQNIEVKANKFDYYENKFLLRAYGDVEIKNLLNNVVIKSQNITYNIKKKTIISKGKSTVRDDVGNFFSSKNLLYKVRDKIIKIEDAKLTDSKNNKYKIVKAFIDLKLNKLIGKDISIDFENSEFNKKNEPRLKGNSIEYNKKETVITKGVFTTCKKNNTCPPWQFHAQEVKHDKTTKTINYKNAWLKLYDKPVFYFPKFFHPDPSVKRQSGFLMPTFIDSVNAGTSLNVPYYLVVSDNKDFTFNPRFYSNDKVTLQTEYRLVNEKSKHTVDFSSTQQSNKASKNHFFSESRKSINFLNFNESEVSLQLQKTSSDTYLKTHKIKSPLISNYNLLTSTLGMSGYSEDLVFDTNFKVYEDLSKKESDRFEFIYPSFNVTKRFNNLENINGNLSLNSSGFIKNYNTNIYEAVEVNNLVYDLNSKYTESGFKNNSTIMLKNVNTDSQKSKNYKDTTDFKLYSILEHNISYPLKKLSNKSTEILKPKISLKYSPNENKNLADKDRRIDVNNIFNLERLGLNDAVEGGMSITYGLDYLRTNENDREIFTARIANIFRLDEDKNLPRNSSLGQKTSNIVGDLRFNPIENLNINYDFSLDENLTNTNYQLLETKLSINNFVTSFEYLNQNDTGNSETYLSNKTLFNISDSKNFIFETRKNKKTRLTEFYNLIYEYRNDCLVAAIEYNKDYYTDRDLKPEENVFFKLTIMPFGKASSPNLIK